MTGVPLPSVGLLNLPDELILRIYNTLFASFPSDRVPDYDLRLARVMLNSRLFRLARIAIFREVIVRPRAPSNVPAVLTFLARQSRPLDGTHTLRIQIQPLTTPLLAAMMPRLFPQLALIDLTSASPRSILPRYLTTALSCCPNLKVLCLLGFDGLRDTSFDLRKLPALRALVVTDAPGVVKQLLQSGSSALKTLELLTLRRPLLAQSTLPWQTVRVLVLQFPDDDMDDDVDLVRASVESNLTQFVGTLQEPTHLLALERLEVTIPLPAAVASSSAPTQHTLVVRFWQTVRVLLDKSQLWSLHIDGVTGWPDAFPSIRHEHLDTLTVTWYDAAGAQPRSRLPLADLHRLLSGFPNLQQFTLQTHNMGGLQDGLWMLANEDDLPAPAEFAIFDSNLCALVQYISCTTICNCTLRRVAAGVDGTRQLRWTRSSQEESGFTFTKRTR
ncbi:hypothetical protein NBRC10512_007580 [Rhodotorula toruloides]|uniref:RHTO0S09e07866g1_1 n=2 Tax=Rhodotorula toruloides TaxID=5286 RepID=A0A061BCM5_RHOTO|nr:uncharacterized protein RHTO_03903 [Rhodotorula toruloides NP11]EMS19860.1 hypothetical protein RHTO_03903 [Rhodotorula toruloides NP11]CDR44711.1 RHTO0S09e07866g1_1 [Rhodotorula toruloides]